jgi:WD40 repeat protein
MIGGMGFRAGAICLLAPLLVGCDPRPSTPNLVCSAVHTIRSGFPLYAVQFSPQADELACGGEGGTLQIWSTSRSEPKAVISSFATRDIIGILFVPRSQGNLLFTIGDGLEIREWDLSKQIAIWEQDDIGGRLCCGAISNDGARLVTNLGKRIRIWEVSTQSLAISVIADEDALLITCAKFSPNDDLLAVGVRERSITILNTRTWKPIATLTGHTNTISSLSFSPDGTKLASSSEDGTVRVWEVGKWRCIQELRGHSGEVAYSTFCGNEMLASAGYDKCIRIWHVRAGQCLAVLEGHTDAVVGLSYCPATKLLASASWDGTVRIWRFEVK